MSDHRSTDQRDNLDTPERAGGLRPSVCSTVSASWMLVLVTVFWGLSFPLTKRWLNMAAETSCPGGEAMASMTLMALRILLALVVLVSLQPGLAFRPTGREHAIGLLIGFVNFLGTAVQILGLTGTGPSMSAFLTSLASAWVPVLMIVVFRQSIALLTLAGLGTALIGVAILTEVYKSNWSLGRGEQLGLLCSLVFAVVIVILDRLGRSTRHGHLTFGLLLATGGPAILVLVAMGSMGGSLGAWVDWLYRVLRTPAVLLDLGLLTVFCTVLAWHWFARYQPVVSATRAALIYLLEPIFSTCFSILYGLDALTAVLLWGGGLIVVGNLVVELPGILGRRLASSQLHPSRLDPVIASQPRSGQGSE